MSSFDKVVKLACKPKAAPPKAKYLDTIIAATWSDDGAVHDVCKALVPRFREPNAIVVFKALIVLHTMIRNGATDNVLSYLSSSEILRLRNVSAGNWEGYAAPENLQNYASYLDSRIRAYHDLKHDAVRVQAESNRDMRNSSSIEEDTYRLRNGKPAASAASGPTRSKTIMGRKLRMMTVEKGLLRETRAVHRMIDALVECRFYLDDLEDELTTTALRMLVKDLLILFQAGNEGVINVLEHYFEMSHVDAEQALAIYRHFCTQTERVVEFLGVAKKLQNLLNVPIPNLKHAPVSLAGALQEYLDDPNFEQNRRDYRANKEGKGGDVKPSTGSKAKNGEKLTVPDKAVTPSLPTQPASAPASTSTAPKPAGTKGIVDFFNAIEEEQPTMFNPQTNSPNSTYFEQQRVTNPFAQMQMMTGQPFMPTTQQTGFLHPQPTAFQLPPSNPFGLATQPTGHRPFSTFLPQAPQPQQQLHQPNQTGFLLPQPTGANPFRQSMMIPQTTGMALFGGSSGMPTQGSMNALPNQNPPTSGQGGGSSGFNQTTPFTSVGTAFSGPSFMASPFSQATKPDTAVPSNLPTRPSSTPLTSFGSTPSLSSPPVAQPVKTHQTGTKNPFGPIITTPPPVPRQPTLMELGMGVNATMNGMQQQQQDQNQQQQKPQQTGTGGFGFNSGALSAGSTDMSSIASSFAFNKPSSNANGNHQSSPTGSEPSGVLNTLATGMSTTRPTFSDSLFSSSSSNQPTDAISMSSAPPGPVKSHLTGFAGLKPFKPSSSFGASLLESLPSIPGSSPTTPAIAGTSGPTANGATTLSSGGFNGGSFMPNSQPFGNIANPLSGASNPGGGGSTLGQGLRPQMTGGAANPFRASMIGSSTGGPSFGGSPPFMPSSASAGTNLTTSLGSNLFGGVGRTLGPGLNPGQQLQQQQQQQSSSLI